MSEVNRLEWEAYLDDSKITASINRINSRIESISNNVVSNGRHMENAFSNMAKAATAFFTISQAQNFTQELIKVRSEFQQLDIAFTTMLGSKEKADQLTKDLIEFAGTTPFGMKDTANAAKQLLAYGSAAKDVKAELRMLGDIASGTSQPIGELVYLYGTLRMQGRAQQMDINQFAGRGIPIYKELANVLKINVNEVRNFVSAGKVGFAEVQKAFQNMTAAGSMFGGLMEAQSKTIQGELERLGDAYDQMLNNIGTNSEKMISTVIQGGSYIVENYETVLNIMTSLIASYGAYRAALVITTAMETARAASVIKLNGIQALATAATNLYRSATLSLNAAISANPYVLGATALAGLVTYLAMASDESDKLTESQKLQNQSTESVNKAIDKEKLELSKLLDILNDNTTSLEAKQKALKELNSISPEYLGNLTLDKIGTEEAKEAVDRYIFSIERLAKSKILAQQMESVLTKISDIESKNKGGFSWWETTKATLQAMVPWSDKSSASILMQTERLEELYNAMDGIKDQQKQLFLADASDNEPSVIKTVKERLKELQTEITRTEAKLKLATSGDSEYDKSKIDGYIDSLKKLREERDSLLGVNKNTIKANNELKKYSDERIQLLEKLTNKEFEVNQKAKSKDEEELNRIRKFYDDLRKEYEDFNKTAPASKKIGTGTFELLNKTENAELGYNRQEKEVSDKLKKYQEDYSNYVKYEQLKNETSKDFADEHLAEYALFQNKIDNEIKSLEEKITTSSLSQSESIFLEELYKLRKTNNERIKDDEFNKYTSLLLSLVSYEGKRKELISKYNEQRLQLIEKGKVDEVAVLDKSHREELNNLDDTNIQKLQAYKDLFDGIEDLTDTGARNVIRKAKKMLDSVIDISPELRKQINDQIKKSEIALNERLPKRTIEVANGFQQIADSVKNINEGLSSMLSGLANILRSTVQVSDGIKGLKSGLDNYQANKSGGGGILGTISAVAGIAGPVGQIVGAVSSVVSGVIGFFKASKESARQAAAQIKEYQASILQGEIEYNKVLRERARTQQEINDLTNVQIKAQQQLLQNQGAQVNNEFEKQLKEIQRTGNQITSQGTEKYGGFLGIGRKTRVVDITAGLAGYTYEQLEKLYTSNKLTEATKKQFESLQSLKNEVDDIAKLWDDSQAELTNRMTSGLTSDSITKSIIDGIKGGKRAFEDFGDDIENIIQDALLSGMAYQFLDAPIKELVDQFHKDSLDGLDPGEIANFKTGYEAIIQTGLNLAKEAESVLGKAIGSSNSSLKSEEGITAVSEITSISIIASVNNKFQIKI